MAGKPPRDPLDRYYTPNWVVRLGIDVVLPTINCTTPASVLDPCAGKGAYIYALIRATRFHRGMALDIAPASSLGISGIFTQDFLTWKVPYRFDLCMTNPPYRLAELFARKCLRHCDVVVFLLRLNWLASQARAGFFRSHRPSHVFVFPKRPSFFGKGTDCTEYAYIVWDQRQPITQTLFNWLPIPDVSEVSKEKVK